MELRIRHCTTYRYQSPVDMAQHMLHLTPRETATQRVLAHRLAIAPEPATVHQTKDAHGNLRTFFAQEAPHEALSVLADALGLTDRRLGATWRTLRTGRFQSTALSARNLAGIAIGPSA